MLGGLSGQGKTTLTVYLCIRSGIRPREIDVNIVGYIIQRLLYENNLQFCPILIQNYTLLPMFFSRNGPSIVRRSWNPENVKKVLEPRKTSEIVIFEND